MEAIILIVMVFLYFIPTMAALEKKNPNGPIVVNLFLGWTFIGWVVALAWAVSMENKRGK